MRGFRGYGRGGFADGYAAVVTQQQPSVGRIVHYVSYGTPRGEFGQECRAAIIAGVDNADYPDVVRLCVLNPTGIFFNECTFDDEAPYRGGSWHWPERV